MKNWEKEYQKKNGIEMRLFVDLMIANQGDKKIVKERLDELKQFISQSKKDCSCNHTLWFALTLGDGCSHIVPHPTKKQIKKYIKPWLKQLLKDL